MPRIPFMHATFRDDLPTPEAVETRLKDTLEALPTAAGIDAAAKNDRWSRHPRLTRADELRLHRRAD